MTLVVAVAQGGAAIEFTADLEARGVTNLFRGWLVGGFSGVAR
jgi:hypothetical protein